MCVGCENSEDSVLRNQTVADYRKMYNHFLHTDNGNPIPGVFITLLPKLRYYVAQCILISTGLLFLELVVLLCSQIHHLLDALTIKIYDF